MIDLVAHISLWLLLVVILPMGIGWFVPGSGWPIFLLMFLFMVCCEIGVQRKKF